MRTIRSQLTRKLVLIFLALMICGGAGIYVSTRAALLKQFDDALRAKASVLVSAAEQHDDAVEIELNESLMREFDDGVPVEFFELRAKKGVALRRSESLGTNDLPAPVAISRRPAFWNLTLPSGLPGRAVSFAFAPQAAEGGAAPGPLEVRLVFASDCRELNWALSALALALFACGALLLAATVVLVPRALRKGFLPLDHLAQQAGPINADSLSTRFSIDRVPGEIEPVSRKLNELLKRLEQSFDRERQFSADLSHELRTPIAELRSLAEVALRWPDSRTAEVDRDVLDIALQMEAIVGRLLELMRGERGQISLRRESVCVARLVESVWEPFVAKARQKELDARRNIPEVLQIESDPVLLRSILTNVIDNAVEYAPVRGTICVEAATSGRDLIIRVLNDAQGLTRDDLARFFDRLWRKDPARAQSNHYGLGLPLARSFAQLLGAQLHAELNSNSCVLLTFTAPNCCSGTARPLVNQVKAI